MFYLLQVYIVKPEKNGTNWSKTYVFNKHA